jgi:serine-type D-Ala-D-Ala carboxypeptidase/endopeptidase
MLELMRFTAGGVVSAFAIILAGLALAADEAAPSAFAAAVRRAAANLPAGGFVGAEFEGDDVRFVVAGNPGVPSDVAPERVLFEIGSITKVFTGLLLAETVLEGKARYNDTIAQHLPPDLALAPSVAAITLEQLSSHTSGLPRMSDNFNPADPADPYADYDATRLCTFLSGLRPLEPPPRPTAYSNVGVGLLGYILERIHGKSYAELLAEKITRPLALDDTVIVPSPEQRRRFAPPWSGRDAVKPWTLDALAGAGAIRSTAADLVKFAQTLQSSADHPLKRSWEVARQPRADLRGDRIGLGIFVGKRGGQVWYSHGGGTGGYRSQLEFSAEAGRGYVLLLNNTTPGPDTVIASLRAIPLPTTRVEVPLSAEQMAAFAGTYTVDAGMEFTVTVDADNHLAIRMTGQPVGPPLLHGGADRFFCRTLAAEFQFGRDGAGRVDSITLLQNGREIRGTRYLPPVMPALVAPNQMPGSGSE